MILRCALTMLVVASLALQGALAAPPADSRAAPEILLHDIFQQLIEIDTTDQHGNVSAASLAMAQRLTENGFPAADVQVLGPNARKQNLVVRFHGTGTAKPILLMGHLDVVEARREDWTSDPFKLTEKNGYYYGRGALDMKDGDAVMVATLIRLLKEHFHPTRDIVLMLTADEEGGVANGVDWLLRNHRDLVDGEFAINLDDWTIWSQPGPPRILQVNATEKVYADFELEILSPGGHSSEPAGDNAISSLAAALARLAAYHFPFELNAVGRAYYERMAQIADPARAADIRGLLRDPPDEAARERVTAVPQDYAFTHTTCVPTRLAGGHANNALPQRATANVNCRILPGHSPEEVREELIRVLADPKITVRFVANDGKLTPTAPDRRGFAPVSLDPRVMRPLQTAVTAVWPGRIVLPSMALGASDTIYTVPAGIPTYTIAAIALPPERSRAHGRDECIAIDDLYRFGDMFYRYLKALATE